MRNFKDLKVWKKSHQLAVHVYKMTQNFPREELFGLTSQIRRACASIPANIAEGCGRSSSNDFARFLHIALGSASELEYHVLLANDLNMLSKVDHERLTSDVTQIKRMLASFIKKLKADS